MLEFLNNESNQEIITKYKFDKIMRKLLMTKGKKPEYTAI